MYYLTMDSKEILHYAQQIEKLHRESNYDSVLLLLKTIENVDVSLEQLQETGIAEVLYQVVKSCPAASVRKVSKLLLSRWKKRYSVSRHMIEKNNKQKASATRAKCSVCSASGYSAVASCDGTHSVSQNEKDGCQCPKGRLENGDAISEQSVRHLVAEQHITLHTAGIAEGSETVIRVDRNRKLLSDHFVKDNSSVTIGTSSTSSTNTQPYRSKCSDLILQALSHNNMDTFTVDSDKLQDLAHAIEKHVFTVHGRNEQKYKACIRSKVSNLRNPKSPHLLQGLLSGELSPESFAEMSVMEMASKELKQFRAKCTESGISEHQLPSQLEGTPTNKVRCRRCDGFDCSVKLVSRGTLFLPAWMRSANPDEEMMTFVTCNGCGQQWYHSGWVCL